VGAERARLAAAAMDSPWRAWGPFVSERSWGTVREDYSADGDAWNSFPHDHARSRAYRWNEDGMAGLSDVFGRLCLGLSLWNGVDPILKEQIPALLQHFDVASIGWRRQSLYRFGIAPNKLMDYMMAARPVLHAVDAGNDPVSEAGCGLTIATEDPPAMAGGIRALLSLTDGEREAMGQRGREFVLNNLTYPILAKRFLAACD